MTTALRTVPALRGAVVAAAFLLGNGLLCGSAVGAEGIDADADKILRSMSSYVGSLPTISVDADIDTEIIDLDGQKLQFSSSSTVLIERPGKMYIHRQGAFANVQFIFDGKTLTLHGMDANVYVQAERPGSVDDAIRAVETDSGLDAPASDLLLSDPYAALTDEVVSGAYLGTSYVNGLECHYLAFRAAQVDWQLWIQVGDAPLPMKYIITSKWITGAPQHSVRFRNWDPTARPAPDRFTFVVPEGAKKLDSIPVNEVGEFILGEDGK